jgi:hypothetical protein
VTTTVTVDSMMSTVTVGSLVPEMPPPPPPPQLPSGNKQRSSTDCGTCDRLFRGVRMIRCYAPTRYCMRLVTCSNLGAAKLTINVCWVPCGSDEICAERKGGGECFVGLPISREPDTRSDPIRYSVAGKCKPGQVGKLYLLSHGDVTIPECFNSESSGQRPARKRKERQQVQIGGAA